MRDRRSDKHASRSRNRTTRQRPPRRITAWQSHGPAIASPFPRATAMRRKKKSPDSAHTGSGLFFSGGANRSRTGLNGFAGRCITALLSRRKRTAEPGHVTQLAYAVAHATVRRKFDWPAGSLPNTLPNHALPNKKGSFASPACFPLLLERETSLELATSTLARLRSTN